MLSGGGSHGGSPRLSSPPASPDLAITSNRFWVAWACCSVALAAAAHRCPEHYAESSTGIEGDVAAVVMSPPGKLAAAADARALCGKAAVRRGSDGAA